MTSGAGGAHAGAGVGGGAHEGAGVGGGAHVRDSATRQRRSGRVAV